MWIMGRYSVQERDDAMLAYIAGPLFNEGERWFDEQINALAEAAGFVTFLPHRDGPPELAGERDPEGIFRVDLENLERADLVVANLNGVTSDVSVRVLRFLAASSSPGTVRCGYPGTGSSIHSTH